MQMPYFIRGPKKHINFFNINFFAPTQNTPERTQKGTHINFFGGTLGVKKGVPNGPFSVTKSLVYCFFSCPYSWHFHPTDVCPFGKRSLSSTGVGKSCALPIRMPNPSPTLDKNLASMGPGIFSSVGVGVWRKASEAFPDSNTTLDIPFETLGLRC